MRLRPAAQVRLPSLSERREDIASMVEHLTLRLLSSEEMSVFVRNRAAECGVSPQVRIVIGHGDIIDDGLTIRFAPAVMEALIQYSWPGNTRELESIVDTVLLRAFLESQGVRVLEIDYYYLISLLGGMRSGKVAEGGSGRVIDADSGTAGNPGICEGIFGAMAPVSELKELRQGLERAYYLECYERCDGDIERLCVLIFGQYRTELRQKLLIRMNQLGIRVSEL